MKTHKIDKSKIFKSYDEIAAREMAELRRMSGRESLRRGLALISEINKWKNC